MNLPVTLRGLMIGGLYWQTEQAAYSPPRQIEQFHVLSLVMMIMKTNSKGCQPSRSYYHPVPTATSLAELLYVHRVYPHWPMPGGSRRVIQAGSTEGSVSALQVGKLRGTLREPESKPMAGRYE